MSKLIALTLILTLCAGCTTSHSLYTGEDNLDYNEEFSTVNTILLPVAIVGVVLIVAAIANAGGGSSSSSSSYSSCTGSYCGYAQAWDYLPASAQYRCRSTSTGQFVTDYSCAGQLKQDNWK